MKTFSKLFCLILALTGFFTLTSCQNSKFEFFNDDLLTEEGKISISPYYAVFNEDGTFTLELGITNSTDYSKIIKSVGIEYVKDYKDRVIVQDGSFNLDEKLYLLAGGTEYIECVFEEEEVLFKSPLNTISTKATLNLEGVVKNGKHPEKSDNQEFTYGITNGEFTNAGGLEGTISIRNNYKTAVTPKLITFNIITDKDEKVTLKPISRVNENEINPGEVLSLSFSAFPEEVNGTIAQSKDFNALYLTDVVFE